jgi:hypothetical protein
MFKNSLNVKDGIVQNVDPKGIKFGIRYYDSMYRKAIYISYASEDLRDLDFSEIMSIQFNYSKVNRGERLICTYTK